MGSDVVLQNLPISPRSSRDPKSPPYGSTAPTSMASPSPSPSQDRRDQRPTRARRNTCVYCSRIFKRREHLQRHVRTRKLCPLPRKQALPWLIPPSDTKDKPYICRCGAAFARRDLLTRHERIAHEQNNSTQSSFPGQTDAQVPSYSPQSPFIRPVHASPLLTAAILPRIAEGSDTGAGCQWSRQTQSEAAFS